MRPGEGSSITNYVIVACGPSILVPTPVAGSRPQLPHPACILFKLPAPRLHKAPRNGYVMTSSCLYPVLARQAIRKIELGVDRAWLAIQEHFWTAVHSLGQLLLLSASVFQLDPPAPLGVARAVASLHIPVMTTPSIILIALASILA